MLHKYLDTLDVPDRIVTEYENRYENGKRKWDDIKIKSPYFSKNYKVLSISSGLLKVPDNYLLH